jgi:hypothetical protein
MRSSKSVSFCENLNQVFEYEKNGSCKKDRRRSREDRIKDAGIQYDNKMNSEQSKHGLSY